MKLSGPANTSTKENAGNSHAKAQVMSESNQSGQTKSGPNWSRQKTQSGKVTEQLETTYQETGAGAGMWTDDETGPGPMETKREPHVQQVMGNTTATGGWEDGGDQDGVEVLAPAAGTDRVEVGAADKEAAKAKAEEANEGLRRSDRC